MVNIMSLKKIKLLNVIFLLFLSIFWHFVYDFVPSFFTSLFFPVNESIWEHMKIIYYSFIVVSIIEYLLCKSNNIKINNWFIEVMVKSLMGIVVYLSIFVPIYLIWGHTLVLAIGIMIFVYILMEFWGYKILKSDELNIKVLPIIILILMSILFIILTYYPLHNFLFFDEIKFGYGILK